MRCRKRRHSDRVMIQRKIDDKFAWMSTTAFHRVRTWHVEKPAAHVTKTGDGHGHSRENERNPRGVGWKNDPIKQARENNGN